MAQVKHEGGLVFQTNQYTVVKQVGKAGDKIERHNHPEANVLFTVVKGKIAVKIEEEEFILTPGKILQFDGNNHISADLLDDSEAFVTLILK